MKRYFTIVLLILHFCSCNKKVETAYSTETLEYLKKLSSSSQAGDEKKTLAILNQNENNYKFANDLKESLEDSLSLFQAEKLALAGDVTGARKLLADRISARGYSEVLEASVLKLDKVSRLQNYIKDKDGLDINEMSREFAQVRAHTQVDFKGIKGYEQWLNKETNKIVKKVSQNKAQLVNNIKFTNDLIAITKPELQQIALLQLGLTEQEKLLPGFEDNLSRETILKLKTKGVDKVIQENNSIVGLQLKDFEAKGWNSLQKQVAYAQLLAKSGDIPRTLEILQELQTLTEIDSQTRRQILKTLFLAKGWNNKSLINQNFIDISYLLETVYKINQ